MSIFLKNISFHGVVVENIMEPGSNIWPEVHRLVQEGIDSGIVQPLAFHSFGKYKLEQAFRFVAEGDHIGKAVIQV